jgi:hypothetical protein
MKEITRVEREERGKKRELRTQGTLRAVRREGGVIVLMGADNIARRGINRVKEARRDGTGYREVVQ